MSNILGIDPGANSIGWAIRDIEYNDIREQIKHFGVMRFEKGVGSGKSGEFSFAAERTKFRSARRLYQSRKYRIWQTLEVLIKNECCPLSIEELNKWRKYDKTVKTKRQYPIENSTFNGWIALDFNNDGVSDYSSVYALRAELATKQLDMTNLLNKYKLGRALYHIAQKRGFKSSKGDTLKSVKENENLDETSLKKSEEEKSSKLNKYIEEKKKNGVNIPTIGDAFYCLEKEGIRVNDNYHAVRSQYEDEIIYIFNFQNNLSIETDFYKDIHKAIFYKRPLRSQKGSVGKCTLEPTKYRCPVSHPSFEYFRAWSFINNIKFRRTKDEQWSELTLDDKKEIYNKYFLRVKQNFLFEKIRKWIVKKYNLTLSNERDSKTINYKDATNVPCCSVSARLKNILGEDWKDWCYQTEEKRVNKTTGKEHCKSYTWEDIWHICFSSDDEDNIITFANKLNFNENQIKSLRNLFMNMPQGYSMLSRKAIDNINIFLSKGLIYSNAVFLAKIPELIGQKEWEEKEKEITKKLEEIQSDIKHRRIIVNIANSLIANYKALELDEQFANKNYEYTLNDKDFKDIENSCFEFYGNKTWQEKQKEEKEKIIKDVAFYYQAFFNDSERKYFNLPDVEDSLKAHLKELYPSLDNKNKVIDKLYHPSKIDIYPKVEKENVIDQNGEVLCLKLLKSPKTGAFKNPMAMRMLYMLRKLINHLLKEGLIDENTRIVVETARELNDSNMRWAINKYQERREHERQTIERALRELRKLDAETIVSDDDIRKSQLLLDQNDSKNKEIDNGYFRTDVDYRKYKLWLEQGGQCLYTGKVISIAQLFRENPEFDIEHTLPQSKTLDNSLENNTICDADFNQKIKKDKLPIELDNYEDILKRIEPWKKRIENLEKSIEYYKAKSKQATTKDNKDNAIRQRHLKQMELDYWKSKYEKFTMREIPSGFTHRNLVDTGIISKYTYQYLKSVFNKVEVQKGTVTAMFRKILGLQTSDENKNRTLHSHHAIDAAVLTMIPTAVTRDKILSLYGEKMDKKVLGEDYKKIQKELNTEITKLRLGNPVQIKDYIQSNIIINSIAKDKALIKAKKKARVRGKRVLLSNGEQKWLQGDCIRGELHSQTYYGAITQKQDGHFIIDEKNEKKIFYVLRKQLKYKASSQDSGFKDWDDIMKSAVDKKIIERLKETYKFMEDGEIKYKSFKEACSEGLYYYDQNNNKRHIRHIRCFCDDVKNPIKLKKQTMLSDKEYKQNYYVGGGDLYAMAVYGKDKEKVNEVYGLFDIVKNKEIADEYIPKTILNKKEQSLQLQYVLKKGTRLILLDKDEIVDSIKSIVNKRLYVIDTFERDGRLNLVHQLYANNNERGTSIKDFSNLPKKIRTSINQLNFLIEDIDFKISLNGEIDFLQNK